MEKSNEELYLLIQSGDRQTKQGLRIKISRLLEKSLLLRSDS